MIKLNPVIALSVLCKRSFYRFVQEFWDVVIQEPPVWNWHIKYLCDELQYLNTFVVARQPKPYDLIINVPPGSTKSTIITQMYTAWVWTIDNKQRHISSSYSSDLSLSHSIKTRDIINSPKYKLLFPEVKLKEDQQSKGDFHLVTGGQRFTTSTQGTVTGVHAHQILVDDPINPKQAFSDVERLSANEHVTTELATRKIDKAITPLILVMQRLHEEDPTGVILGKKGKKVKHINLPAEIKSDTNVLPAELVVHYVDGLLDPIRLNRDVLAEAFIDLGSYKYAGQFDQKPAPEGGGLLKKHWFQIIPWEFEHSRLTWNVVADTAYSSQEEKDNDPSGWFTYAQSGSDYIIRFAETEHLDFPDLCKRIKSFAYQHGYTDRSIIEVEPKASGKSLVQTLRKQTGLNVKEGIPPSKDKVARVKDASPVCESGRVKLIAGPWNKPFIDQLVTFPNAKHDEWVDCLTMMINKDKRIKQQVKHHY